MRPNEIKFIFNKVDRGKHQKVNRECYYKTTWVARVTYAATYLSQGVLRLIWSGRLECVFVDPKGAKISKNGNNITCRLSKNKHFLFYTQGRGGNIRPATPS